MRNRIRYVKSIKDKLLSDVGGMNYPASVATGAAWPKGLDKRRGILVAEHRRSRIRETERHEQHERELMRRAGRPYTMAKYRRAHHATVQWERRNRK